MSILKTIKNILRKPLLNQFVSPKSFLEITEEYDALFIQAIQFTQECGFKVPILKLETIDALESSGDFVDTVFSAAGINDASASSGQCLKWCHHLQPYFEKQLRRRVYVTIGQFWKENGHLFNPSFDELKQWTVFGIQLNDIKGKQGVNLHAWLTVDTGEIIDPTYLSSLAAAKGGDYEKFAGAVIWGRDGAMLDKHRYYPMLIGTDAAEAIGKKSVLPLLAAAPEELYSVGMVAYIA